MGHRTRLCLIGFLIEFKDDLTGVLDVTINFIDVVVTRLSYLGAFVRVSTNAHYDKVTAIAKYGFQASLVVNIEDLPALDTIILRRFKRDGHRIYLSSTAALQGPDTRPDYGQALRRCEGVL